MPLFIIGAIGTAIAFPAASYLFSLPLWLLLIVSVLTRVLQKKDLHLSLLGGLSLLVVGTITLLLFVPIVYLVYVALALPMAPGAIALAGIPLSACTACAIVCFGRRTETAA